MKIAVIDDERPARSELIHQILQVYPESEIAEADSGMTALELISTQPFDILFIDINLNDMEGTALAVAARKILPEVKIVFATAYSQFAVKAFELEVNNYILKPFDPERVRIVLKKCGETCKESLPAIQTAGKLVINNNRKIVILTIADIVYLETDGRGCALHTVKDTFTDNRLLGEFEKQLAASGFFRLHKSFLVNLDYISEIFPWNKNSLAVKMQGFEEIILPVGRERVKQLRRLMGL